MCVCVCGVRGKLDAVVSLHHVGCRARTHIFRSKENPISPNSGGQTKASIPQGLEKLVSSTKGATPLSPALEGTSGHQWYPIAFQSTCWLPGSLSITSTCYIVQSPCWHPDSSQLPVTHSLPTLPKQKTHQKTQNTQQNKNTSTHGYSFLLILLLFRSLSPPFFSLSLTLPHPSWSSPVCWSCSIYPSLPLSALDSPRCLWLFSPSHLLLHQPHLGVALSSVYTAASPPSHLPSPLSVYLQISYRPHLTEINLNASFSAGSNSSPG